MLVVGVYYIVLFLFHVRLPNFHGIVTSFEQYPRDWHVWYTSAEPESTPLPGKLNEIVTHSTVFTSVSRTSCNMESQTSAFLLRDCV